MNESTKAAEYKLVKLAGLDISATPMAIVGTLILWVVLGAIAYLLLKLPLLTAIIGGLGGAILHQVANLWHQLGHSWAARRTGHPMTGIRFGYLGVLSTALYPANEGELPPAVHIQRAIGGPLGSLVMSIIALIIFLVINSGRTGGTLWWLGLFFFLDNFVLFTLEIFLPLGFNDGSTLMHWLRQRQSK